jgi:hypothetical protein
VLSLELTSQNRKKTLLATGFVGLAYHSKDFLKMIFFLVLKLEISSRVIIS